MTKLSTAWVRIISVSVFLIPTAIIIYNVIGQNNGTFTYPLDDTYINMAIAKNLSQYGIWGISKYEFASASASILYPLLLAAIYLITGPNLLVPLVINIIASIFLIVIVQKSVSKKNLSSSAQLLILVLLIVLTPIPVICIIGMEHIIQLLCCFLFLTRITDIVSFSPKISKSEIEIDYTTYAYGVLVCAIRYEDIFLVIAASAVLLYYRKYYASIQLFMISTSPLLIFGIISLYNGNYFLPNAVFTKPAISLDSISNIFQFITNVLPNELYYTSPTISSKSISYLLISLVISYLFLKKKQEKEGSYYINFFMLAFATLSLIIWWTGGSFFRYESNLIGLSLIYFGLVYCKYKNNIFPAAFTWDKIMPVLLAITLACPLIIRANKAFELTGQFCSNIYKLQYHAGDFVHKYYDKSEIAGNQLGTISFLSSGRKKDLFSVVLKKENADLAIINDQLNNPTWLKGWKKAATWRVVSYTVVEDAELSFYAVDSAQYMDLKNKLTLYQNTQTNNIMVTYY